MMYNSLHGEDDIMLRIDDKFDFENDVTLFKGDALDFVKRLPSNSVQLVVTSPPYAMGKSYERPKDDLGTFISQHELLFPEIHRILRKGGSVCWQVGYHVKNGVNTPLDILIYNIINELNEALPEDEQFVLRNRIIWTFGHGLNAENRFSGRHETILWFTKGKDYLFNLDPVRVPQKYPGKKYSKGPKKGEYSGNPLGKNPSDIWEIPNVKANHVEKTEHPCQFPITVPRRLIQALTNENDIVFDPFNGSGSTGIATLLEKRKYIGTDIIDSYIELTRERLIQLDEGTLKYREDEPVYEPTGNSSVDKKPDHFKW